VWCCLNVSVAMPGADQHPDFPIPNYRRRRPLKASDYRSATDTEAIHPSYPTGTQTHEILDRGDATTSLKSFRVPTYQMLWASHKYFCSAINPPSSRRASTPISSHGQMQEPVTPRRYILAWMDLSPTSPVFCPAAGRPDLTGSGEGIKIHLSQIPDSLAGPLYEVGISQA
jgi:hypothetical protein